jgi:spore germination cell wall hydrolase CwlJ-like protein
MSRKTKLATAVCFAATIASVISAQTSGAHAQDAAPDGLVPAAAPPPSLDILAIPASIVSAARGDAADASAPVASLADLVARHSTQDGLSRDLDCLASAIYFEARGEPLIGQLAVGSVVVNRATSGRFPASYCGVVYQPSQFSFIRGGRMPSINRSSLAWTKAKALATIADEGLWQSPAPDALFFHASHVKPRWKLQRVAQVSTHVFYR